MSNQSLINDVMNSLKVQGYLMMHEDFIDQLITTLHANVTTINTMTNIAEIENQIQGSLQSKVDRQVKSLKSLSKNLAEIAFNVEGLRDEQR